jgi:histidyl-tRNA synthetase
MARSKRQKQIEQPRGINDIAQEDQKYLRHVMRKAEALLDYYGFERTETSVLENQDLVRRVLVSDENTDKKLFNFKGRDEVLALRYDHLISLAKLYVSGGMSSLPHPVKLFCVGPVFSSQEIDSTKMRQNYQLAIGTFGDESEIIDAELIFMAHRFLDQLGLDNYFVHVNSMGDASCRANYIKVLKDYYRSKTKKLCSSCRDYAKTDPLKVLICKNEECREVNKEAPQSLDSLDEECRAHFKHIIEYLDEAKIPYILDPLIIGDRDYYNRTIFQFLPENEELGGQAIIFGGRFDRLVDSLGGSRTHSAGLVIDLDKTITTLRNSGAHIPEHKSKPKIFFAQLGEMAKRKSLPLFEGFRKAGIEAKSSLGRDSIKSQLRIASRYGVKFTLIFGQKEALDETIILRDMETSVQETIPVEKIIDEVKKRIKN